MSKAKRFISILLAGIMVFSVVSFELATVVASSADISEKAGVTVTAPPVIGVSATKVVRVAAAANSLLPGNTLVKATPSGVPDLGSATYANAAYAGETPIWPTVSITLPAGTTLDASPALTITAGTVSGSVSLSPVSKNGQTYSASVTGGTASAGNNIIYTISYYYEGANYITYAYTYVESIVIPSGIQYFYEPHDNFLGGVAGKMFVNYRYLGVNVYGSEVPGGAIHGYYDFSSGAYTENPASPNNVQLKVFKDNGTGEVFNGGYAADDNRPQASIYIDTSTASSLADLNFRISFFLYDTLSTYSTSNYLAGAYVQAGNVASVSESETTTAPGTDAAATAQLGITGTASLMQNKGDTITATFNGPGPAASGSAYTVTMLTQAPQADDGNRTLYGYTSICLNAYKYDKGALRTRLDSILSGVAGKGINPQSWYYSSGWDYFKASLDQANLILNKPNTDQAAIDAALLFLNDSYNSLYEKIFTYTVNSFIQGTTTSLIPAVTGTGKYSGYVLFAQAQSIPGYTLANPNSTPAKLSLTLANKAINFYYTPLLYTISFQSNEGSPVDSITAGYGTAVVKPNDPSRANYMFTGWYSDEGCTQPVAWPIQMPLNGATLYAGWSLIPVTLSFNSNNGTPVSPVTDVPGTSIEKPADPERAGFSFAGWYYDISFTQKVTWPVVLQFDSFTVYAKWSIEQYTVDFNTNGGTGINPITVDPNTAVYPPGQPEKTGYTFAGWYYDNGTFTNSVKWPLIIRTTGYSLYAKWTPINITITFDSLGGSAIAPLTALADSPITAPDEPTKFGYVFAGWTLDGNPFTFGTMPVQNTALVAIWSASPRAAQVKLDAFKTFNGDLIPVTSARAGDVITVVLSAKTNFYTGASRFVIMYDSNFYTILGTNKTAITPNGDNAYYATAISNYGGATTSPTSEWPSTFVNGESSRFKFVAANFTADFKALNGGYPVIMSDSVSLFRIRLQIKATASGSGKIYMDRRWDRSLTTPTGIQYYYYCPNGETLSSNGDSVLNFDTDYTNANETVVLDTSVPTYTSINFNTDGGTAITALNGEVGTATSVPANPVKEGNTFLGWSPAFPSVFPASSITLTALWQISTYNANFVVDGIPYYSIPTQYGALINAPANPTKVGYSFAGWSPAVGTMGASNSTYTALFQINNYYAYFVVDGQVFDQFATEYGAQIQLPENPQKTGHTFTGWSPVPGTMPASNSTFTAQFSVNNYYAYFVVDSQTTASISTPFGEQIIPPPAPTKPGHAFSGWSPAVGVMGAENMTFTALWDAIVYNAVFMVDGSVYNTAVTIVGENITLPANPVKEGYTFTGWNNLPAVMPGNDVTITATWAINTYKSTFMVDGLPYSSTNTEYGAVVVLPAAPEKTGFTFNGWSNLPSSMPAHDLTLNALFTANTYNAAFRVDGEVYKNVPTLFGTEIVAPANPVKAGYIFMGWLNVPPTMPANDVVIDASFAVITYTATFMVDTEIYTTVTTPYGSAIGVPADPNKVGYFFTGWDSLPATMPDYNIVINATFTKNIYKAVFMLDGEEYATKYTGFGETIELPPIPSKVGYSFLVWDNLPVQMPGNDVVITGIWSVNAYDAVFIVDTVIYDTVTTNYGDLIKLPAVPVKQGFFFGGWSPAVPQEMPAYNLEFTAIWVSEAYYAIFMVDGQEYNRVLTGIGAPVLSPASPVKAGYIFLGWDPGLPNEMPAQQLVFNAMWYFAGDKTVSFSLNGGSGTIPASQAGPDGTIISLPAQGDITRHNYIFLGWATAPNATEPLSSFTISAQDATLYAVWSKIPVILSAKAGSATIIDKNTGFIYGLEKGISASDFAQRFVTISGEGELRITFLNGSFGTGTKIELLDSSTSEVLETYTIVIFGDLNGDGQITLADRDVLKQASSYQAVLAPGSAFELAADLTQDGIVDVFDLNIIRASLSGIGVINQTNPGVLV